MMHNTRRGRTHRDGWLAACLALLLGLSAVSASASIVIRQFTATAQGDGSILVAWETATELNTVGFNLYRARSQAGPWDADHLINQQPAQGSGFTGAVYQYRDTGVMAGVRYYYLLEELTSAGPGVRAGPIRASVGPVPILYLPLMMR